MASRFISFFFALTFLSALAGADHTNYFVNPPLNGTQRNFTVGEHVTLQWVTDYPDLRMILFQGHGVNAEIQGAYDLFLNKTNSDATKTTSYPWTVSLTNPNNSKATLDLDQSHYFFFEIWDAQNKTGNPGIFKSGIFYINAESNGGSSLGRGMFIAVAVAVGAALIVSL